MNVDSGTLQVVANGATLDGTTDLLDGLWHQFVVVLQDGGASADAAIYIDGKVESTTSTGDTSSALATVAHKDVLIGKGPAGFFNGLLDDIRLYDRALEPSEVDKLHQLEAATEQPEPEVERPDITQHPVHATVASGGDATFTVIATGKPTPTYTWQKLANRKWATIKDAVTDTLTVSSATSSDATTYRVIVTNSEGYRNSKSAKLYVLTPPSFTKQPTDQAFLVGKTGNLYAHVSGSKKLVYEWFKDGTSLGTTSSNKLTLRKMKADDHDATYSVKVSNPVGEVTSDEFQVSVIQPVKIEASPEDAGIVSGQDGSLTVTASGGGTLAYQWMRYESKSKKWIDVEGATSAILSVTDVSDNDQGKYKCRVTNGPSTYFSKDADVVMFVPPTIKKQPRGLSQKEGSKVSLKGEAIGSPAPAHQWQKLAEDGSTWEDVPKANRTTLYFSKVYKRNAGKYRLKATNQGGL